MQAFCFAYRPLHKQHNIDINAASLYTKSMQNPFNQIPYACRLSHHFKNHSTNYGSGVFVSPRHILTAAHVIAQQPHITVQKTGWPGLIGPSARLELPRSIIAKNDNIDVALLRLPFALSAEFLKVATHFEKDASLTLATWRFRGVKTTSGHYMKPCYDVWPDITGARPASVFKQDTPLRPGMSGSPYINEQGEIVSIAVAISRVTQEKTFWGWRGDDIGATPDKFIAFFEPHRAEVEAAYPAP